MCIYICVLLHTRDSGQVVKNTGLDLGLNLSSAIHQLCNHARVT